MSDLSNFITVCCSMKKIWFLLPLSYYVQVTQCQQQPANDHRLALSRPEWEASRKDHLFPISSEAKMCSEVHSIHSASLLPAQVISVTSEIIFSKQRGSYNPYGTRLQKKEKRGEKIGQRYAPSTPSLPDSKTFCSSCWWQFVNLIAIFMSFIILKDILLKTIFSKARMRVFVHGI